MTIKQLTYLIEVKNTGSFTAASKKLGVSQGVVSQAIKDLETELGFKIFDRSSKKIEITKQGFLALTEAKKIMNTCNHMLSIKKIDTPNSIKIRTFDFSLVMDTFNQFVKKYECTKNTHLSLKISEYNEIISGVLEKECDIGILCFPYNSKHGIQKYLDETIFNVIPLCIQQMYVKLRKDHPVLKSNNPLIELKNYKLVHFRNESFYPNTFEEKLFIDFNNTIYINDKIARYEIVSSTNAYMIGMQQLPIYRDKYNLHEIEIKNRRIEIVCFYKKSTTVSDYMNEFIELLVKEFSSLFNV